MLVCLQNWVEQVRRDASLNTLIVHFGISTYLYLDVDALDSWEVIDRLDLKWGSYYNENDTAQWECIDYRSELVCLFMGYEVFANQVASALFLPEK